MCSNKVYLLTLVISTLLSLSFGEGLYSRLSRSAEQPVGQISEKKCEEYSKLVKNNECTHFNPESDKTWDYPARTGEFPHMALLSWFEDDRLSCAGSIISEKYVLTTAVCARNSRFNENRTLWVRIGQNALSAENSQAIRLKVIKSHLHPKYDAAGKADDIGLLELEKEVKFDQIIRPACLNTQKEIVEPIFVSGWGIRSSAFDRVSSTLLKTELEISKKLEYPMLNVTSEIEKLIITRPKPGKKDACSGDSGAPVMTNLKNSPCMYNIVGIISFGGQCSAHQTASTRVSNYIPWIERIVWPQKV